MKVLQVFLLVSSMAASLDAKAYHDVEYSQAGGQTLLLDAEVPDGPGPFPAAIIVHGGAWVTGDKVGTVQPLFSPLHDAGIAWFSINYRLIRGSSLDSLVSLASLVTLQSAVEDVRQAIAYVKRHAAEYNIDPARIALIGESAGAHLTQMAALRPAEGGAVRASVAFYAPSDLVDLVQTSNRIPNGIRQAVKGTALETMLLAGLRELSPRNFVSQDAPPSLLVHGTRDGLVPYEQSVEMCAAIRQTGSACELYTVEGGGHGLRWWQSQAYKRRMTEWLAEVLR